MHKLKQIWANAFAKRREWLAGNNFKHRFVRIADFTSILAPIVALFALGLLVWYAARPIPTAEIKVPVATDRASYAPGDQVSGIFFGEIFYSGEVRILREVFCKEYKDVIRPPEYAANGDFFNTQSIPRKLEGYSVAIGSLPADIPVGLNCVLQFTNVYRVQTPFGERQIEYQYYTQNFAIISKERRQQLDCEAAGRKDCDFLGAGNAEKETQPDDEPQSAPEAYQPAQPPQQPTVNENTFNDNRSTTTNNNPPAATEPAPRYEERCAINLLGVKVNCRQVRVN